MSSQVFCPKCGRAQPAADPGSGDHFCCGHCQHAFTAKGRPQPLPPQVLAGGAAALVAASREDPELPGRRRTMSDLPAAREAIPSPTLGLAPPAPGKHPTLFGVGSDLPMARPADAPNNLPMSRAGAVPGDLPAPRQAIPYANLPAPREAVPFNNLPAPREAVPLQNLPAARGSQSLQNLPAAREAVPPSNLPVSLGQFASTNLPAARESIPWPNLPGERSGAALGNLPAPRGAVPLPNLPAARTAVPLAGGPGTPIALGRLNLERNVDPDLGVHNSPLSSLDLASPDNAFDLAGLSLDLGDEPPRHQLNGNSLFGADETPHLPSLNTGFAASSSGLELDLLDDVSASTPTRQPAAPGLQHRPAVQPVQADLGFNLDIEGATAPAASTPLAHIHTTSAMPAIEVNAMGILEDAVPTLAPHREADGGGNMSANRTRGRGKLLAAGVVVAALAAALLIFVLPMLPQGANASTALAPYQGQLDSDNFAAYKQASDGLLAQAEKEGKSAAADELRASAAELLLLARVSRQAPKAWVKQAEQVLGQIEQKAEQSNTERRARALLEVAQARPQRASALLAGIEDAPGSRLVVGLGHLASGEAAAAVAAFEVASSAQPERALAKLLLAQALEAAGQTERAHQAYLQVTKLNGSHAGAALGAVRTSGVKDQALLTELQKLVAKHASGPAAASAGAEVAALNVLMGRTAAAMGQTAAPGKAFTQALVADPSNVEASIALAETLLREGRFNEALARTQTVVSEARKSVDGLFTLGGALIATHRGGEGLALVEKATGQAPTDPRGPYYRAWAAEGAPTPNVAQAIELYQDALKLGPAFVPASLRLASLLQKQNRAGEALKVLKAAEHAGAPPTVLQMAWGQALIVAKQPEKAEDVFRKVLATDATHAPSRMGLASALETQGRLGEAKLELEGLLAQNPQTEQLRERLAALAVRLGEQEEAVAHYEAALASGKAGPEVHVALGRLALEMGKHELAQTHLEKVAEDAPGTPGALYHLGQLREKQGALGKALAEYRRATSYENTPEVQLAYGRVLLAAGKEDDALLAFREAFTLAEGHLEHGRVLLKRGKPDKAITDFQAAVSIDPEQHEAYLLMGNSYDVLGEPDKAAEAWRNVVRRAPRNIEALYKLGRLEMDRAQIKAALDYLRKAADDVPEDRQWAADVFFQLGYAELQAGSKKNARDALARYLALAPTDAPDRPAVEKQLERLGF